MIWIGAVFRKLFCLATPLTLKSFKLKRTFATPSDIEIDKSGAFNEYSRNLATPKKIYATPSLRNTGLEDTLDNNILWFENRQFIKNC